MIDPHPREEPPVSQNLPAGSNDTVVSAGACTESPPKAPAALTPEEQMELYEKDLKENDWGHQPC